MSSLPKSLATLGGIVGFCAAEMLSLLRDGDPFAYLGRACACAVALAALTYISALVGMSVLRAGLRQAEDEGRREGATKQ